MEENNIIPGGQAAAAEAPPQTGPALNDTTAAAIAEGRAIAREPSAPGFKTMEELRAALEG